MNVNVPRRIFRTLQIVGGLPTALMLSEKEPSAGMADVSFVRTPAKTGG